MHSDRNDDALRLPVQPADSKAERRHGTFLLLVAVCAGIVAGIAMVIAASADHDATRTGDRVAVLESERAQRQTADVARDKRDTQLKDLGCVLADRAATPDPQLAQARRDLGCAGVAPTPTFGPTVSPTR